MAWFRRLPSLGMLLLCIWLVASGLMVLISLSFAGSDKVLAILAIAAGVLLFLDR